jgi:predicted DNA-binding protein (MmcQ/YjbR family)
MTLEKLRKHCLSLPGATEQIQWGADLVFKVGGKMFCVACTEVAPVVMSMKCDEEAFAELVEREGVIPAPYLARARWVALERFDALSDREIVNLVSRSHQLVVEKLPKKLRPGDSPRKRGTVPVKRGQSL